MITQEQIEKIVKRIIDNYNPEKSVLFGSYAYGHPAEDSDLDLLVVKNSDMPRHKRAREIRRYLWGITDVPKDGEISKLKEDADKLTDYAVEVRYPEEWFEPSVEEAKDAFEIVMIMKEYVSNRIWDME